MRSKSAPLDGWKAKLVYLSPVALDQLHQIQAALILQGKPTPAGSLLDALLARALSDRLESLR